MVFFMFLCELKAHVIPASASAETLGQKSRNPGKKISGFRVKPGITIMVLLYIEISRIIVFLFFLQIILFNISTVIMRIFVSYSMTEFFCTRIVAVFQMVRDFHCLFS